MRKIFWLIFFNILIFPGHAFALTVGEGGYNDAGIWKILFYLIIIMLFLYVIGIHKGFNRSEIFKPAVGVRKGEFARIAGLEEPKRELVEILEFIQNPAKFKKLGARIPRGVILYGPPGTGKTLLAKSLAAEAGVEFIYASGSEFVEKYVGMGAFRVRELFARARRLSAAVIFIDELDALGKKRGDSDMSIEKDQTLNQLLTELDGFNSSDDTIVVIGATNMLNLLDTALLRPGRFDRHISIGYPCYQDRCEILKVHTRNKPLKNIDIENLAYQTSGLTGADLANICNESAIIAARNDRDFISNDDINMAVDRIIAGIENKAYFPSDDEKRRVAFHEAGHAVCGFILTGDSVKRVSILPRGESLGFTIQNSENEKRLFTKRELMNKLIALMGGRAAEEIVFNEATSGASNDIEKATDIAVKMVAELGMSERGISNRTYILKQKPESIYPEVEKVIKDALTEARKVLKKNETFLHKLADYLIVKETIYEEEVRDIYNSLK